MWSLGNDWAICDAVLCWPAQQVQRHCSSNRPLAPDRRQGCQRSVCADAQNDGRLYALSTQLGLIRFTRQGQGYVQESYGDPVPDLPTCAAAPAGPCASTMFDMPPIPNDVAFDSQGNAYVTDSLQATIWRYPAGGGAAQIWFQDSALEGGGFFPFGTNGLRINRQGTHVALFSGNAANFVAPSLSTLDLSGEALRSRVLLCPARIARPSPRGDRVDWARA
ncbi:MAG: hypothetical protein R6W76_02365 [Caldilinea sp.]